ncbi:unnamed protein product [Calicophoron daubneyi]|uniref:Solute carrier family 35 member B1 n=1 Tax=Calicophoron daubneyi TaxID=300641 RepID=A0AAV2TZP9_CALDB
MGSRLKELSLLVFCALGVFFSYLLYGIFQENVTKTKYRSVAGAHSESFNYFFSLLLFQCVVNSIFSKFALRFNKEESNVKEFYFALCGFTYIGAMFASNFSLKFISYPTQVIGKSVKPIPVMLLNVMLAKRTYPLKKYFFIVMISLGVFLFMFKNEKATTGQIFGWGECLLLVSLLLDGFTGGIQEKISKYKVGSYTMMLHMNIWSVVYLSTALLISGEGSLFINFARKHPEALRNMLLLGIASAVGQIFLFTLITKFGSLMCAVVTTTRKFFTVLASVVLFNHTMSSQQWIGTLMVFAGIFLDQYYGKVVRVPCEKKLKGDEISSDGKAPVDKNKRVKTA